MPDPCLLAAALLSQKPTAIPQPPEKPLPVSSQLERTRAVKSIPAPHTVVNVETSLPEFSQPSCGFSTVPTTDDALQPENSAQATPFHSGTAFPSSEAAYQHFLKRQHQPVRATPAPGTPRQVAIASPQVHPRSAELALHRGLAPSSGSQLYSQRIAALKAGKAYTRLSGESFYNVWRDATHQPTYEQWRHLLTLEAQAMAKGQGSNKLAVLIGDSLSLWFPTQGLPRNQLWLNQAISGETTAHILQRLPALAHTKPQTIYLMAGINDLRKGASDAVVLGNLRQIMRRLRQNHPQTRIIVQSILPTRATAISNQRIQNINSQLSAIANQERVEYLDVYAHVVDGRGNLRPELTTDGLHLNPQGYAVWQLALQQSESWNALKQARLY